MLLILIPVAWLALVAFFVILAQMAARGDAMLTQVSTHPRQHAPRSGRTIAEPAHTSAGRAHGHSPRIATAGLTMLRSAQSQRTGSRRARCVH
ncbi:MAG: hypothetical protein JWN81_2654 [Solirubrobacterales bacterium]|jgi:hypothetical protein|nr:hypothetical protein [Solirubrobacterales bacterium]